MVGSEKLGPAAQSDPTLLERMSHNGGGQRLQLARAPVTPRRKNAEHRCVIVLLAGMADQLVAAGAQAADDLQDTHLVELSALHVPPGLRSVAERAQAAAGEPGEP